MGSTSVLVDGLVYRGLAVATGLSLDAGKGVSYLAGVVVGFAGNKFWTFESSRRTVAEPISYLTLYAVTLLVNIVCNRLALSVLGTGQALWAFLFATGVTTVLNFLGMRLITFRKGIAQRRCASQQTSTPEARPSVANRKDREPREGMGARHGVLYLAHRINTVRQLLEVPTEYGVELDLRDDGDRLVLQHDPFRSGEDFAEYLKHYHHGLMILNVKSERIEHRVLELIRQHDVKDYFFLDCSFPMIRQLVALGEHRIAVRFSEYEPIESALALAGQVDWVWVDCFTKMPLDPASYAALKQHFRLCAVSPELQGRPVESIAEYARQLDPYPMDAICTKRPDLWQQTMRRAAA